MRHRFRMGRALTRLLTSLLPIGERLGTQPRLCVVVGHHLGLYCRHLGELRLQGLEQSTGGSAGAFAAREMYRPPPESEYA